ncbi:hypothetical protein [Halobacillus amylolyticus]|uniref:Uncharacterized protein n=1 Tax=Halobacillus amylolyticus TaxID=2932259 RepID=A0ABY4H8T9_9BACI|nr:hypothetical protein [Halobacillus amylolyticus]UOR11291.1 hypothetical protein MUO15_17085 [Halobacillus amylolyticus]
MKTVDYTLSDTGLHLSQAEIQNLIPEEEYWFLNEKYAQALRNVDAFYQSQNIDPQELYRPFLRS